MKFSTSLLLVFIVWTGPSWAQPKIFHQFFSYQGESKVLISGHRGGMMEGFAENSISSLQKVLESVPAFFEIDPRLSKDSVVVLMHDATLDRTTTGKGKVSDFTLEELKQLRLKDAWGNVTDEQIPTLEEAIFWAKGKTVLNLDHKGVPFGTIADLIKKQHASAWVMLTVHSPEQAQFYLKADPKAMFSAHIKTREMFDRYEAAGIPWTQMIAYIGSENKPENDVMIRLLHEKGVKVMVSTASTYDKLPTKEDRAEAYRAFMAQGPDILGSDLPIEAARALDGY